MLRVLAGLVALPAMLIWRLAGWRFEGALPPIDKYIFVFAPHTSNWDYIHMLPLALRFRRRPTVLIKDDLFRGPLGVFLRLVGAIPIDRRQSNNAVDQVVDYIATQKRVVLVITPEGTRKKTDHWKSGFYHIARKAGIPIVLGYLDYERKVGGASQPLQLSGDVEADLATIRAFYAEHGRGKRPQNFSDIRFRA
jgi:1-acyl-sn-glycerol-3-phosphate acyltransferase